MKKLRVRACQTASLAWVIALCGGLLACAEDRNFPSLSKIADFGTVLTPEQRDKTIQDLQRQGQSNTSAAPKTAE